MQAFADFYINLFDKKIENNTLIVLFIAILIVIVSYLSSWIQWNVVLSDNIVNINWVNYQVSFEKIP